jgi:hypothetical protein
MKKKILHIESQILETENEKNLMRMMLNLAKEAGYTHVHDHWGHKAWDEYPIDELIKISKLSNRP